MEWEYVAPKHFEDVVSSKDELEKVVLRLIFLVNKTDTRSKKKEQAKPKLLIKKGSLLEGDSGNNNKNCNLPFKDIRTFEIWLSMATPHCKALFL